jgi:hypothetical protein
VRRIFRPVDAELDIGVLSPEALSSVDPAGDVVALDLPELCKSSRQRQKSRELPIEPVELQKPGAQ